MLIGQMSIVISRHDMCAFCFHGLFFERCAVLHPLTWLFSKETVNTVCLGFSYECSEFSQSCYFLELRVKNVFSIKYLESFMY